MGGGGIGTFKGGAARLPVVTSIEQDRITVAGKKTYLVDSFSTIVVDGRTADLAALRLGMKVLVNGRMIERGDDTKASLYKASRITARSGK